jgi:hypothetical protein
MRCSSACSKAFGFANATPAGHGRSWHSTRGGSSRLHRSWLCHSRAISEGQPRCRADNHGHYHPTAELAVSPSSSMNASREYA